MPFVLKATYSFVDLEKWELVKEDWFLSRLQFSVYYKKDRESAMRFDDRQSAEDMAARLSLGRLPTDFGAPVFSVEEAPALSSAQARQEQSVDSPKTPKTKRSNLGKFRSVT